MHQVIVAFERPSNCDRIRELLEGADEFSCLVCRSGAQVRRAAGKLGAELVVCGFKLADESCESVFHDLPQGCAMLMVAPQAQLDLCEAGGVCKLPTPVRRSELLSSVRQLLQPSRGRAPGRSQEERELVERAKRVLIRDSGMTEDQAHRFLQKRSMDSGARLTDTARLLLEGDTTGGEAGGGKREAGWTKRWGTPSQTD